MAGSIQLRLRLGSLIAGRIQLRRAAIDGRRRALKLRQRVVELAVCIICTGIELCLGVFQFRLGVVNLLLGLVLHLAGAVRLPVGLLFRKGCKEGVHLTVVIFGSPQLIRCALDGDEYLGRRQVGVEILGQYINDLLDGRASYRSGAQIARAGVIGRVDEADDGEFGFRKRFVHFRNAVDRAHLIADLHRLC